MSSTRQYDIILIGASGYTGRLTAEQITTKLPSDLKWALAGRSATKLETVAAECKSLNADRIQPAIEVCNLVDEELSALAKKTTLLITTIGPYALYGEHAFKACAESGTHYLDVTGELPWVAEMIKKYEGTAKTTGSIMIPQIGLDSAPPDLVTWKLVDMIHKKLSAPTSEVVISVHEINSKPSGGTLASTFTVFDIFSLKQLQAIRAPYCISPIPGPRSRVSTSWTTKLFGVRAVPDLGILTTHLGAGIDIPVVQRSWGLLGGDNGYGPNFQITEMLKVRNHLMAVGIHIMVGLMGLLLSIPFLRKLARRHVYQPGDGPTKEQYKNDRVEYRGVAKPDVQTPNPPTAFCKVAYEGSAYQLTAVSVSQAAITILRDDYKELTGGIYTPATLGQKFIDRLDGAGFKFQTKMLNH